MKITVFNNVCGLWSPSSFLFHNYSSTSVVSGSACFRFDPKQADCSLFISMLRELQKSLNKAYYFKKSTSGLPFCCKKRMMPQTKWCSVLGGYSGPFCFLTSRMKWVSQYCREASSISTSGWICTQCPFIHALWHWIFSCTLWVWLADEPWSHHCQMMERQSFAVVWRLLQLSFFAVRRSSMEVQRCLCQKCWRKAEYR